MAEATDAKAVERSSKKKRKRVKEANQITEHAEADAGKQDITQEEQKRGKKKKKTAKQDDGKRCDTNVQEEKAADAGMTENGVAAAGNGERDNGAMKAEKKKKKKKRLTADTGATGGEAQGIEAGEKEICGDEKVEEAETVVVKKKKKRRSKLLEDGASGDMDAGVVGNGMPSKVVCEEENGKQDCIDEGESEVNGKVQKKKKKRKKHDEVELAGTEAGCEELKEAAVEVEEIKDRKQQKTKKIKKQERSTGDDVLGDVACVDEADKADEPIEKDQDNGTENGGSCENQVAGSKPLPFRRVKSEEWIGRKGSMDNRYEATFGHGGWGHKAQQVLGKVRGRDFRHEKTKKKRGSYTGGKIDLMASTSFKYDSD